MAIPALVGGVLPVGRHPCTEEELCSVFVEGQAFSSSKSRKALWQHWEAAIQLLTSAVVVHRAWISGSFTTEKLSPRDIDVTFIVNGEDRLSRSAQERQIIESFELRRKDPITGKPVPAHGLLVDSYVIDWAPYHPPVIAEYAGYAQSRGYWDDWWSRVRKTPKTKPAVREDAFPERGYLEVNFSDFV